MSDLEARIAEVLGEHKAVRVEDLIRRDGAFTCACGSEFTGGPKGYRSHQAAMLAPVIREAQAEALAGAAKYFDNRATMFIEGDLPAADERRGAYTAEAQHAAAMLTRMADNLGAPNASNT